MTATMRGIVLRMTSRIRRELAREDRESNVVIEVRSQPEHYALVTAWRSVSVCQRYLAPWRGPGRYALSGNVTDGATVTKVGEPSQMQLAL